MIDMYVCICRGITDKTIRETICQGADRMRDLKNSLGVTEQCGICACHVKQILDQTLSQGSESPVFMNYPADFCETAA